MKNKEGSSSERYVIIIFDKNMPGMEYTDVSTPEKYRFRFSKNDFEDPNLHIGLFHGFDQSTIKIKRKQLDKMKVMFSNELSYEDWIYLSGTDPKCYIIQQDKYLVSGSLDPEYEFEAFEVVVSVGGVQ